jgi:hypothetical protein
VEDLGSPDAAAARILDKYLNKEFMSTRIGIRREGEIISAASRQGSDGKTYYDIEVRCHGSQCHCWQESPHPVTACQRRVGMLA